MTQIQSRASWTNEVSLDAPGLFVRSIYERFTLPYGDCAGRDYVITYLYSYDGWLCASALAITACVAAHLALRDHSAKLHVQRMALVASFALAPAFTKAFALDVIFTRYYVVGMEDAPPHVFSYDAISTAGVAGILLFAVAFGQFAWAEPDLKRRLAALLAGALFALFMQDGFSVGDVPEPPQYEQPVTIGYFTPDCLEPSEF